MKQNAVLRQPEVRSLVQQLEMVLQEAPEVLEGLDDARANWRAAPDRWSVLQCLEHLTRSLDLYLDPLERMLGEARAREAAGEPPYRDGWLGRMFVRAMEPPPRFRVRAPRRIAPTPKQALDRNQVLHAFLAAHGRLLDILHRADGVSLRHARMSSPFFRPLRLTLAQALAATVAHARRHLWQARSVRRSAAFPA